MAELAIFSAPKPFTDTHIATIQRNAIRSWAGIGPWVDVYLIGDEAGVAEAAAELGVGHLPDVRRSQQGTPQVDSMIELARAASDAPALMLLNADIIVMPNVVGVVKGVRHLHPDFLLVGRRHNLDVDEELSFHIGYEFALKERVSAEGQLAGWNACDDGTRAGPGIGQGHAGHNPRALSVGVHPGDAQTALGHHRGNEGPNPPFAPIATEPVR